MKNKNSYQCSIPGSHTKQKCCEPDASTLKITSGCTCNHTDETSVYSTGQTEGENPLSYRCSKTDNISVMSTDTPGDKKSIGEQKKYFYERSCQVSDIGIFEEATMKKIAEFEKGEINFYIDDQKIPNHPINFKPKTENYNTTDDLTPQDISYWENFGHFKESE